MKSFNEWSKEKALLEYEVVRPGQVTEQQFIDAYKKAIGQYSEKLKEAKIKLFADDDNSYRVDSGTFNRSFNINQGREAGEYALNLLRNHLRGQSSTGGGGGHSGEYFS